MGLEAAVAHLVDTLKALTASVEAVQFCAVEDRPKRGDSVLVDLIDEAAEDVKALLRDARKGAAKSRKALGPPPDLDRLRLGLAASQAGYGEAARRFAAGLSGYDRIAALKRLGRDRGGEWKGWSVELTRCIDRCQPPLHEASEALVACWQEVAERAGATNISVRAVSHGPKITHVAVAPPERDED